LALPLNNFYIVRAHNVEKDLWTQMAQKNSVPLKWIYQIEQKKMAEFEKNLYVRSDLIAAVSETDQQKIMQIDPKIKAITTSIGLQWDNLPQYINQGNLKLFFIGRLDWYPNSEGLIWFLENVWNEVIKVRSDIALDIVGGFASEKLESLIKERLRVNYHRQVNDISKFYQQCSLTIIPIWTGSGTRVKAIEAATFGRSFLSTTKGIEGINLDQKNDYLKADSKEEWIKILKEVTIEKSFELGKNLFDKVKKEYDQTIIQKDFIKNLKELKHD
jgi:hypothetical protein